MTIIKKYANVHEVSAYTGIPEKTLYCWSSSGFIPSIKVGKKILFDLADVDEFLAKQKRTPRDTGEIVERKVNEILYNGGQQHNQRLSSERKEGKRV